jgi:hypothetical protein
MFQIDDSEVKSCVSADFNKCGIGTVGKESQYNLASLEFSFELVFTYHFCPYSPVKAIARLSQRCHYLENLIITYR